MNYPIQTVEKVDMDQPESNLPEINLKVTTRKIESKVRKLKSGVGCYHEPNTGIPILYDTTEYTLEEIKEEVSKSYKNGELITHIWFQDYPSKIK